jgi:25S rRNA (adenine2142-N1)-methyltransferase
MKSKSLSHGRPPFVKKQKTTLSSKATRSIIRRHHTLLKEQSKVLKAGDREKAEQIAKELHDNGGLETYQEASKIGQLECRGGDTSKVLITWLEAYGLVKSDGEKHGDDHQVQCRVLEIGCLSPHNAISKCKEIDMLRIDLHSSDPLIVEQDFMTLALPTSDADRFDLISLSLVLNYVADPTERGNMLIRTTSFLRQVESQIQIANGAKSVVLPALFFVLPLPCVTNSRYMTKEHLEAIMVSLGYELKNSKATAKIFYSLWQFEPRRVRRKDFKKAEIAPGPARNNFSIAIGNA